MKKLIVTAVPKGQPMADEPYKVVIGSYSLAVGEIGKPTGRPPIVREHATVVEAMRDLHAAIGRNEAFRPGEGQTFHVEMPGGRRLALDALYQEVFGEPPVRVDGRDDKYPWLFDRRKFAPRKPRVNIGTLGSRTPPLNAALLAGLTA